MRKSVSGIVLAVLMACLFLPFAAGEVTSAHACCRVHGVHHCVDTQPTGPEHALTAACRYHAGRAIFRDTTAVLRAGQQASAQRSAAVLVVSEPGRTVEHTSRASGRAPPTYLL